MFLDSSAIIELFKGSDKGRSIEARLEREAASASILSVVEVANWCLAAERNPSDLAERMKRWARLVSPSEEVCLEAARIRRERRRTVPKFGTMDALILASARSVGEKLLTCDEDFRGLEDVEVL